ncbi:hypothetical protein GGX14DRAFT_408844 [Mycena pura]|uniref:Uncharacterized protein n=1 Tax=Mycena pura TaxID=153505 RepID=A0AAD6XVL2_9AGAR|nr:hypothetical protein GGX14DRAFT_408844 [Mycena pura]
MVDAIGSMAAMFWCGAAWATCMRNSGCGGKRACAACGITIAPSPSLPPQPPLPTLPNVADRLCAAACQRQTPLVAVSGMASAYVRASSFICRCADGLRSCPAPFYLVFDLAGDKARGRRTGDTRRQRAVDRRACR